MITRLPINLEKIELFYRIEEDGSIYSIIKQRYLRAVPNKAGYLHVCLHLYMPHKFFLVHRLVAAKYNGQCPPELEACHNDGNKWNNHYSNIIYKTHSQNVHQSYDEHGRKHQYTPRIATVSFLTKQRMAEAKKKPVAFICDGVETIFPSIEDAAQNLNTYRKKIYNCITYNKLFSNKKDTSLRGFLSFAPNYNTIKNDPLGK
jgi:hypothetical protein